MEFGLYDHENVLYTFEDLEQKKLSLSTLEHASARSLRNFRMENPPFHFGGHKSWISPQELWEGHPFIDLENGEYRIQFRQQSAERVEVQLTSPLCRETHVEFERLVVVEQNKPYIDVSERLTYRGTESLHAGLWTVTQMKLPQTLHFGGVPEESTFPFGIKNYYEPDVAPPCSYSTALRSYSVATAEINQPMKIGTDMATGWILLAEFSLQTQSRTRFAKLFPGLSCRNLPHGCNLELYFFANRPCVEVEVLSPVSTIFPNDAIEFQERWFVWDSSQSSGELLSAGLPPSLVDTTVTK